MSNPPLASIQQTFILPSLGDVKLARRRNVISIISSVLISLTLFISWMIWMLTFREHLEEVLDGIINPYIQQDLNFEFDFVNWTIMILVIAGLNLMMITVPIFFLSHKNWKGIIVNLVSIGIMAFIVLAGGYLVNIWINYDISSSDIIPWDYQLAVFIPLCIVMGLACLFIINNLVMTIIILVHFHRIRVMSKAKNKWSHAAEYVYDPESQAEFINPQVNVQTSKVTDVQANVQTTKVANVKTITPVTVVTPVSTTQSHPIDPISGNQVHVRIVLKSWSQQEIDAVWEKGQIVANNDPTLYRKDFAGAWIFRSSFTNELSTVYDNKTMVWAIDHRTPLHAGGTNNIDNLVPLNAVNAQSKGDNYPSWSTILSSSGNENIIKEQKWKV